MNNYGVIQEGWVNLLRNSQKHFPPTLPKGVPTIEVDGVIALGYRLSTTTAKALFGNKLIPVLNINDPLVRKLIRQGHILRVQSNNTNLSPHFVVTDTLANMNSGPYASFIPGIKKLLNKYVNGCTPCQKEKRSLLNPMLGSRLTKLRFLTYLLAQQV